MKIIFNKYSYTLKSRMKIYQQFCITIIYSYKMICDWRYFMFWEQKYHMHIFITSLLTWYQTIMLNSFFHYNQFNHMVISELHAKLIQQRWEEDDMVKMTMNDFVSRLCLLPNAFLNARVNAGLFAKFHLLLSLFYIEKRVLF